MGLCTPFNLNGIPNTINQLGLDLAPDSGQIK